MTMSLTFPHTDPARSRVCRRSATFVAVALMAIAAPVVACEKSASAPIANATVQTRLQGAFTGEWVDGAPVYRLPSITVVGHLGADVARTQRNDDAARTRRSRASAAPLAPAPSNVATASRDTKATNPCIG